MDDGSAVQKVGILGSGIVARTLGSGFLKYGYRVMLGTRSVEKLAEWQALPDNAGAKVGSFADAAAFGDVVVLAVRASAAEDVVALAGDGMAGKLVIDTTNPIADQTPENGVLRYFSDINASLLEKLQGAFPDLRFVKAFSCVGSQFMVNPTFMDGPPTMFICGNDPGGRQVVAGILTQFGWDVEDLGMAEAARAIEPLAMLWCIPGLREQRWSHALKLLRR